MYGQHQAKMCLRTCTKCADSNSSRPRTKARLGICSPLIHYALMSDFGIRCPHILRKHISIWWLSYTFFIKPQLEKCTGLTVTQIKSNSRTWTDHSVKPFIKTFGRIILVSHSTRVVYITQTGYRGKRRLKFYTIFIV